MFGKIYGTAVKPDKTINGTVERIGSYVDGGDLGDYFTGEYLTLLLKGESVIREFEYARTNAAPIRMMRRVWSLTSPGDTVELTIRDVGDSVPGLVAINNLSLSGIR